MKRTWRITLTVVLVAAMTLTLAFPAFAVEASEAAVTAADPGAGAEIQSVSVANICPFCGEEITEVVYDYRYTDKSDTLHTVTPLIRGEHCGRTFYERDGTSCDEPHDWGERTIAEESHLSTVSPSEHYVIYEWRCNECNHLLQSDRQSTGCTSDHCYWQLGS